MSDHIVQVSDIIGGGFAPSFFTPAPAAPYVGPGDVVSGAAAWWGLRAYSSAAIGTNAVRLRESGGNTEQDFATIAGGGLNIAAIATFKGSNSLFIVKLYDQVGTNHFVQATAANQPGFTLSGLGSLPIISFAGASPTFLGAPAITVSMPYSFGLIAKRSSNFTTQQNVFQATGPATAIFFPTSVDSVSFFRCGGAQTVAATDNVFHTILVNVLGAGNDFAQVDSSNTTAASSGDLPWNPADLVFGTGTGSTFPTYGAALEAGVWAFDVAASAAALNTNQHGYWGF